MTKKVIVSEKRSVMLKVLTVCPAILGEFRKRNWVSTQQKPQVAEFIIKFPAKGAIL